jgi:hypothetical protein
MEAPRVRGGLPGNGISFILLCLSSKWDYRTHCQPVREFIKFPMSKILLVSPISFVYLLPLISLVI